MKVMSNYFTLELQQKEIVVLKLLAKIINPYKSDQQQFHIRMIANNTCKYSNNYIYI